jgi:AcrR family transcriptional regulator
MMDNSPAEPLSESATPKPRAVRPRGDPARARAKGITWQAEKSQGTRAQILEATLQCLVDLGYTQTTTEKIAQKAGVSRGAMTHHFKSRADVFNAAAEYITDLRAAEYEDAVRRIKLPPANRPTFDSMLDTLTCLQKYYYDRPSFTALQELQRGARTDPDLQAVMQPLEQALDDRKSAAMLKRFPFWADYPEASEVLRDLFFHSLKGVAVNSTPYMRGERLTRLHHLLASVAMSVMEKADTEHSITRAPARKVRRAKGVAAD